MPLAESFVRSGKVRDIYSIGDNRVLLVASDRISAFDVILPTPIPDKGRVLTALSRYWFMTTAPVIPNHLLATNPAVLQALGIDADVDEMRGRMMLCRRARVLPVEVIIRGYIAGSGWKDYVRTGAISGVPLPVGLRESDPLPEPILTPSTKAEQGRHDENITFDGMVGLVGGALAERIRDTALRLYAFGAGICERAGIILADTKFEFGLADGGELILVDEILTPDSSRFWDTSRYAAGGPQPSYDKQYVRDWLEQQAWDKTAPGPELPDDVVAGTRERYVTAFERITGASFDRYLIRDEIG
jgi:phosphoribosylaminoimidazole-succinocarboxamide synthase